MIGGGSGEVKARGRRKHWACDWNVGCVCHGLVGVSVDKREGVEHTTEVEALTSEEAWHRAVGFKLGG